MKASEFVLKAFYQVVSKAPRLFNQRIRWASESYFEFEKNPNKSKELVTYSLLDANLKWKAKGVHFLIQLNAKDINKIKKWQKKRNRYTSQENRIEIKPSSEFEYWANFGVFVPKGEVRFSYIDKVEINFSSKLFHDCSVYFYSMSRGVIFLSLYLRCKDHVTALLKDIDVSDIKEKQIPLCFNPFSKHFGLKTYERPEGQSIKRLKLNLDQVHDESICFLKNVVRELGIKSKALDNAVSCMDFWLDAEENYLNLYCKEPDSNYSFSFKSRNTVLLKEMPSENEVVWGELHNGFKSPFHSFYVKSLLKEKENLNFSYITKHCNLNDSHHILSFINYLHAYYKTIDSKHSKIMERKLSSNKKYKSLYKLSYEISECKKTITSINKNCDEIYLFRGVDDYLPVLKDELKRVSILLDKLDSDINHEKLMTNELIQSENLEYHKKYSKYVFALIIVQIVIGILTVNWVESWSALQALRVAILGKLAF
ncbi:hypothetical protein EEA47_17625 [Vibrio alginolyticus]|uniref:hypothetical protein n=1 Tax=Vibrio alginolyticus TaxID=663 RepID=UPI00227CF6CD|nr:hypothetical protein [Vibrio alginolyticus]WAG28178.1 hypothetical protein EEA47_17625 [Vibrio alginolyticus]